MTDGIGATLWAALDEAAGHAGRDAPSRVLELADALGIAGYLARVLDVEADGVQERRVYRGLESAIQRDAALEIGAAFRQAGVPHFFYKGIALLGPIYEVGDRTLQDIDLHVLPTAREAALEALTALGYQPAPDDEQPGPQALRGACVLHRQADAAEVENVTIDLHWAVEPLDRVLPRATVPVPDTVWESLGGDALTVPTDACHLVLLAHHVAHHDMLHLKGVLDFALVWQRLPAGPNGAMEDIARAVGAWRAVRLLAGIVSREFALPDPRGVGTAWDLRASLIGASDLRSLVRLAVARPVDEVVTITPARIRRRLGVIDRWSGFGKLLADVVAPPRAHLLWRWPDAGSALQAWGRHATGVFGKLRGD